MRFRVVRSIYVFALLSTVAFVGGWLTPASVAAEESLLPIVYVHGGAGSAAQYETQAMRFASNHYPNMVTGIDRTSSYSPELNPMLDEFFDNVMAETGAAEIFVVGHSYGVLMMNNYLNSSPERSARVAKYIGIDSGSAGAVPVCPGNPEPVDCMGIYRDENQHLMLGSNNVYLPKHGHTQAVTSEESFSLQYEFFTGEPPETTLVVPEPPHRVEISGKAVYFPANTGVEGATLLLWEVNGRTGARRSLLPEAIVDIDATGEWGPIRVNGLKHYEFTLIRDDVDFITHYYFQPFVRDNHLIRLLSSEAGSGTLENAPQGPDHSNLVVIRYKEWWADQAEDNDTLWVSTESRTWDDDPDNPTPPMSNLLSDPMVGPRIGHKIGIHLTDMEADKVSTLEPIPYFLEQFFQTGVDVWMPATCRPDGTITLTNEPRGDTTLPQTINVRNWPSESHRISVQFNSYAQEVDSWPAYVRAKLKACHP